MGSPTLLIITIGFVLFLGGLVPLMASSFTNDINNNGTVTYTEQTQGLISEDSLNLSSTVNTKGLNAIGGNQVNFITQSLNFWSLVPEQISIPILIIISAGFIVGLIKAFTPFA